MPISKPSNSAKPRIRPKQEYPDWFFVEINHLVSVVGRIGMETLCVVATVRKFFIMLCISIFPSR